MSIQIVFHISLKLLCFDLNLLLINFNVKCYHKVCNITEVMLYFLGKLYHGWNNVACSYKICNMAKIILRVLTKFVT